MCTPPPLPLSIIDWFSFHFNCFVVTDGRFPFSYYLIRLYLNTCTPVKQAYCAHCIHLEPKSHYSCYCQLHLNIYNLLLSTKRNLVLHYLSICNHFNKRLISFSFITNYVHYNGSLSYLQSTS